MLNNDEWLEIIAIRFGEKIAFAQAALDMLEVLQTYDQLISRSEFRLLSKLDLGDKWGEYAEHAPTLFKLGKDTSIDIRQPNMLMHRKV